MTDKLASRCSAVIGIGLVLSVIHQPDQPFLNLLFLPVIGNLLVIFGAGVIVANTSKFSLGPKALWIPLAVISGSIILRPLYALLTNQSQWGMNAEWAGAGYGAALFALYLASRYLGERIFKAFIPAVIIASASMVWWGLSHPGVKGGGIVSVTNYDIIVGFLVFGWVVSGRHRWWLAPIVLVGLYFTGSPEALFVGGVLGVVVLVRQDWSKRLALVVACLVGIVALTVPFGIPQQLYSYAWGLISAGWLALGFTGTERDALLNVATGHRWLEYWVLSPIRPLGYGYNINNFYYGIPHNVVLIIIEQVGVVAAIAWVWVVGWGVWKSKWKYAWVAIIALSFWDHYVWTQMGLYLWCLAGASSSSKIESDKIFSSTA